MISPTEKNNNWYKLDNAAKLYPSIETKSRIPIFRLSVTLKEAVDPAVLKEALVHTINRFPAYRMRLKKGLFWHYLDYNPKLPGIERDVRNPCMGINKVDNNHYLFRVRYFKRRIAVEIYHSITDGFGGMVFLKTLTAEYLKRKGLDIPAEDGVLDINQKPAEEELEDAFLRFYAPGKIKSRREKTSFKLIGTNEKIHRINIITGIIPLDVLKKKAKECHVSITEFLTSVYIFSLQKIQKDSKIQTKRPVRISVPVNLRQRFPSGTLRNFSSFVGPCIHTNLGEHSFEEILRQVHHYMGLELNEKHLKARMSVNVAYEKNLLMRIMPLFIKDFVVSSVFKYFGENLYSGTLSNIGMIKVPKEMEEQIERFDFVLGPNTINKCNGSVVTFGNKVNITFSRIIKEPVLENVFFNFLVKMDIPVLIESNQEC